MDENRGITRIGVNQGESKDNYIPIWKKVTLSINEAAAYSGIGIQKLQEISRNPRCPFVLHIGRKKVIKRKEFEEYISKNIEI